MDRLEKDCELPQGFHLALLKEGDWSFVLKLHALLEKAVTQLLVHAIGIDSLSRVFSAMEMSNTKTGKIALCKLSTSCPQYILDSFALFLSCANKLMHNVENAVGFDIVAHFSAERQR